MYLKLINLDEFNLQRSMILEIYDWLRSISIFLCTPGKLRFPGERISIIGGKFFLLHLEVVWRDVYSPFTTWK